MTDEIKNALAAEEWREKLPALAAERDGIFPLAIVDVQDRDYQSRAERHALAALCLNGQPFGFDESDLEWVLTQCNNVDDVRVHGEAIAAKIRALLPPRP